MMNSREPRNAMAAELKRALDLTQKAIECAAKLGLSPSDTAAVLGVPQGIFQAMKKGTRTVDGYNGEAERVDALVRIIKRLSLLLGTEETLWRAWLRRTQTQWGHPPIDLLLQRDGVQRVAALLEQGSLEQGSV